MFTGAVQANDVLCFIEYSCLHSTFSVFPLARGQEEMGKLSHLLQFSFTYSTGIQITVKDSFS